MPEKYLENKQVLLRRVLFIFFICLIIATLFSARANKASQRHLLIAASLETRVCSGALLSLTTGLPKAFYYSIELTVSGKVLERVLLGGY